MGHEKARAEVIRWLSRMITGVKEHGHYSFCGLDAGWAEKAINVLIEDAKSAQTSGK